MASLFYNLAFTVNPLYFIEIGHLDSLQLLLVGTMLEAAVFIFEIPTGVVADIYSRRLSIIIRIFLVGLGFLLMGARSSFSIILLSQVLLGVGYAFTSGISRMVNA